MWPVRQLDFIRLAFIPRLRLPPCLKSGVIQAGSPCASLRRRIEEMTEDSIADGAGTSTIFTKIQNPGSGRKGLFKLRFEIAHDLFVVKVIQCHVADLSR